MTTAPASINFRLYPHATFAEVVTLQDSLGAPIDLTGKTAKCQIRREATDLLPLFDLSSPSNGLDVGGALGTVTITISALDTGAVTVDPDGETWIYDLLLTDPTPTPDVVERAYQGYIFVIPGVTRP
jgi:hypothetical protein